jgi:NADH-quinone oxidoreductase subunit L
MQFLWLIPALPFLGFVVLAVIGKRMPKRAVAAIGTGSVGMSALISFLIVFYFIPQAKAGGAYVQKLWEWISAGGLLVSVSLRLDSLSLIMIMVVLFVGFLIHLYSTEYMAEEEGYSRFFAWMNLFVGSMLTLVLADGLLLLYLGWEGVGLCSYLLIGFWYRDPANGRAAIKAFIVTRVGDAAVTIALFIIFISTGTLEIQSAATRAGVLWPVGSGIAFVVCIFLLLGAMGKSAQFPLQTWLPDAMAGPTPVSALIHAATMVTAGVYLIARTHAFFELAPSVMLLVGVIGAITLLLAGASALFQKDIKRVLAYSTMSQIGYMFLALGVGAFTAAIFHFMTHAFFKALLFLSAGVVINAMGGEHDIEKMGGLRKSLPLPFWSSLIGAASLASFPLVTAGYYSKDKIIAAAWASGNLWLWGASVVGALLTGLYIFRLVFKVFFGKEKDISYKGGMAIAIPLIVLIFFSIFAGFLDSPFTDFLRSTLPIIPERANLPVQIIPVILSSVGIFFAYLFFYKRALSFLAPESPPAKFFNSGWGFDWLYDRLFVRPYIYVSEFIRGDIMEVIYGFIERAGAFCFSVLSISQTGRLRWYAMAIVLGAVITLSIAMLL